MEQGRRNMDAAALHVNSCTDDNPLVERDLGELVSFELAVQRTLADPQDLGRLATIALRLAQRGLDRCPLHIRHCHASAIHHFAFRKGHAFDRRPGANSRTGAHLDDLDAAGSLLQPPTELFDLELKLYKLAEK